MSYNLTGAAQGGNAVFITPALTGLSGGATTFSAAVFGYSVKGQIYSKTISSGAATPTTDLNSGAAFVTMLPSKACVFMWCVNAAGTVQVAQGAVVSWLDTSASSTACPMPSIPDLSTPFALVVIKTGATTAASGWLFGTGNWNATGVVIDTVVNLHRVPPTNPLTA